MMNWNTLEATEQYGKEFSRARAFIIEGISEAAKRLPKLPALKTFTCREGDLCPD